MYNFKERGKREFNTYEWFKYWRPCTCGHLSHEHRFSTFPFALSIFNGLTGGSAWVKDCKKCECPKFKHGDPHDKDLLDILKKDVVWGYIPYE